jgi:hypothetical protein
VLDRHAELVRDPAQGLHRRRTSVSLDTLRGYLEDVMAEAFAAVNPSLVASVVTVGFHNPWA